jgi:hypothetical protein
MGKRNKKTKKVKKVELSKTERFVKKSAKRLFVFLAVVPFTFILLNIAFSFGISISVELYFFIVYLTALPFALFIIFGFWNSLFFYKISDNKNIKSLLLMWIARISLFIVLIIDIKVYVFPMTLDMPRLITGHYKEMNGTVKSIETNDYERKGGRGKWYEKIKYVYFTEQKSGKTIKVVFHCDANKANIEYSIKNIHYLAHSRWGIQAE